MQEEYYLVFIHKVGTSSDGENNYELFFAKDPTVVFGDYWSILPISLCTPQQKLPHESTIDLKKTIKTDIPIKLATNSSCHSMMDVIDGILALCWEDISMLEEYPEYRLVLHYGETMEEVINKLNNKKIIMT